jgi:uncharacterized protein (DUF2336 family)
VPRIVEDFLRWTSTASVERRTDAAQALARSYLLSPLDPQERDQIEAAMTVLLDDRALEVRVALAQELARSEQAPHHIILLLAGDKPPVAAIVAEHSPIILDSELVDLAATREPEVQAAIARRPFVSRSVAAAISEVSCAEACLALLENKGARLLRFSLDRIVDRHGDVPELRFALLERDDLPLELRQTLISRLAASLKQLIVSHDWMATERADAVTREARELATIAAAFEAPATGLDALVVRLMQSGELTPAFLIRTVASGQTALFGTALSMLARMPRERVGALVASGRGANLKALLQRAGLPPRTFPAFQAAIDVIREDAASGASSDYRRATHLIDAIVARYGRRRDREMDAILALLRRFATEAKRAAARDYALQVREAA